MSWFYKSLHVAAIAAAAAPSSLPKDLDLNDPASIRDVASTLAYGTMSLYSGNVTNTPDTIAVFPSPVYWWESGACWGSMLDYFHYTGDASYNEVVTQALLSQVGPTNNFMDPVHYGSEGNDDQAFWSFTVLNAAERNYPQPNNTIPPWLTVAENIWNSMVTRWNTTHCGGGLAWQIFASNPNGMNYKNSVSNGGFFQMSARLARDTDNETYTQWAEKVWDWSEEIGFVGSDYLVYDGADSTENCSKVNQISFSYSQGIYLYGAAVMYNHTNGNATWGNRVQGLLQAAGSYFSPYDNATNIMYEHACETVGTCNTDMLSFKAYLSRFMWATTQMMPSTLPQVQKYLNASAIAAGKACSGGNNGTVCGQKWYVGGYDDHPGLGQQMSALETVQGLLVQNSTPPLKAGQIKDVKPSTTATTTVATATSTPTPSKRSNAAHSIGRSAWPLVLFGSVAVVFSWL